MATAAARRAALRAAPGLLVLARGAAARLRLPADRPLLSRRLHGRDLGAAVAARHARTGRRTSTTDGPRTNDSGGRRLRLSRRSCSYIGIFAFRTSARRRDAEDYFLAGRSLGPAVFLLSLFGANMTAFSILGASGHAFANGIVTFGLMASSSALDHPAVPVRRSARGSGRSASATAS